MEQLRLRSYKRQVSPPEICIGHRALDRLKLIDPESRTLLLITPHALMTTWGATIQEKFKEFSVFDILPWQGGEPSRALIEEMRKKVREFSPDWIIGVGGGSVLDAAKFLWASYEHLDLDLSKAGLINFEFAGKSRLALIPTTAGSGSEASESAVLITDAGLKVAYISEYWIPSLVILDPIVTTTLPFWITVGGGFDALSHAIESAVSILSHPMSRSFSASAARGVFRHLSLAAREPLNLAAREAMQVAAYIGGFSQSSVSTGAAHALAHAASQLFKTPHSTSVALFLEPTIALNSRKKPHLYNLFASECGLRDIEHLLVAIHGLSEELKAPRSFDDLIGRSLTSQELGRLIDLAIKDVCMHTNPCRLSRQDLGDLLTNIDRTPI